MTRFVAFWLVVTLMCSVCCFSGCASASIDVRQVGFRDDVDPAVPEIFMGDWPVSFYYDSGILTIESADESNITISRMAIRIKNNSKNVFFFAGRPQGPRSESPFENDDRIGKSFSFNMWLSGRENDLMISAEFGIVNIYVDDKPSRLSNFRVEIFESDHDPNFSGGQNLGRVVMIHPIFGQERPLVSRWHGHTLPPDTPSDTTTPSQPPETTP